MSDRHKSEGAPYTLVTYLRRRPFGGLETVDYAGVADVAIVSFPGVDSRGVAFELPNNGRRDDLAMMLHGIRAAYSLGHRDRVNVVRRANEHPEIDKIADCSDLARPGHG